jgi:hypothetical protein
MLVTEDNRQEFLIIHEPRRSMVGTCPLVYKWFSRGSLIELWFPPFVEC